MIPALCVAVFAWGVIVGLLAGYEMGSRWGAYRHGWHR